MNRTVSFMIGREQDGLMVKTVLSDFTGLSRREISRLKFTGGILCNGETCRVTQILHEGDRIDLVFSQHDEAHAVRIGGKPDILYEDEDLVIVNKPAGMPCHPSHEHLDDDMGTVLQNYYGGSFRVRPIGRLDKDVSGIMLYAKNQPAAARLSKQRGELVLHKEYTAIAEGIFENKKGTLTYSLAKVSGHRERKVTEGGQKCVTDYEVIGEYGNRSLLKISIVTGRTHQIRAGMAYAGHPLCGDKLYGGDTEHIRRAALHCSHLHLRQPFTQKEISLDLPLPDDMKALIN